MDIHFYLTRLFERGKRINFCWSPAHVNIKGNEEADQAAKRAASGDIIMYKPVPYEDLRYNIRIYIKQKFNNMWSALTTNSKLKEIKSDTKPWSIVKHSNRRYIKVLNRLRIGHSRLTHSYLLQNPHVAPICHLCQDLLSIKHIIVECPNLAHSRIKWKIPNNIKAALGDEVVLEKVISFLKENNFYYDI